MRRPVPPFPDRLRHMRFRRGHRHRLVILGGGLLLAMSLAALPSWKVRAVEVDVSAGIPSAAGRSLQSLRGMPVVFLNLGWVRQLVQVWPAAGAVEVRLEMPSKLLVHTVPAGVAGSIRIGRNWHAVTPGGEPGTVLATPVPPVLTGFDGTPASLRSALSVADRIARETGRRVLSVTSILPGDLEVHVGPAVRGNGPLVLHVAEKPAAGEVCWTHMIRTGRAAGREWADLRFDDRVVVGEHG